MKSQCLPRLSASKAWFLISAVLDGLVRSNGQELYAFEMLEDEEAMPPYEVLPVEDISDYQVTSFQEVDGNGTVTGVGVLAFTLNDIVYTQERLLCEEESCCEARNYSYEDIDLSGEEDYFPPCSIDELVDILQQNCSIVPFSQSISEAVFAKNVSTMCGYYTLYNQSNVSSSLLECVQDVFDQRWSGYCEENEKNLVISGVSFSSSIAFIAVLLIFEAHRIMKEKGEYNANSVELRKDLLGSVGRSIFFAGAWYSFFLYSFQGFFYTLPSLLNEYGFSSKSAVQSAESPWSIAPTVFNYLVCHWAILTMAIMGSHVEKTSSTILSSIVLDICNTSLFITMKALSMFALTMEFYASEFGETENQTLVLTGSILMALISGVKNLKELNFLRALEYVSCNKGRQNKWFGFFSEKNDYLCHVYPKIQAMFSSLLAPIVFGSFLSTFSSMTVTAGSNLTMQTLSYLAFVTLNYCATIIGDDSHAFHLAHETIISAMEAWAFMHTTNINMLTHEQFIDRAVYYDQYSDSPYWFAGLMCVVSLFCFYYQLSASQFIPELLKASVRNVKKDRKRSVSDWRKSFISADSLSDQDDDEKEYACLSFNTLRKHAQSTLLEALKNTQEVVQNLLKPAVEEAFLSKRFYRYLCKQAFFDGEVAYEDFVRGQDDYMLDENVYKHYLKCHISQRSIDSGYAHPAVLQALAEVKNILLRMWHCNEEGALCVHCKDGEYDYGMYKPTVRGEGPSELDVLFVGGHHFELIESGSLERSLMSGTKEFRRHLTYQGIQAEQIALNKDETTYFYQGFEGNISDRRYELMITNTRSHEQKRKDLNRLSQEVYTRIVFRTIAGGYFVDRLVNYFSQNAREAGSQNHGSHGHSTEPLKLVTVQTMEVKKKLESQGDGSIFSFNKERDISPLEEKELTIHVKLGEDFEEHSSLVIHGPTMLGILLTLGLGSVPFVMNLNDAINAVKGCLADLNASSQLNCSAECFNHYSAEIDVQDIGSSWLVLTCYLLLIYVVIKTYSLDRQKTQENRDHEEEHGEDIEKKAIKHQRLRLASLLYYTAVALVSFAMGGIVLRQWKSGFDINEQFGMNCSGDGPFRDTKRHLAVAANLCFAIGGVIGSVLFLHVLAMSIREKWQCVSKVRCVHKVDPRKRYEIVQEAGDGHFQDAVDRSDQPGANSGLVESDDASLASSLAAVDGSLGDSGTSSSLAGIEMRDLSSELKAGSVRNSGDAEGSAAVVSGSNRSTSQHSVFSMQSTPVSDTSPDGYHFLNDGEGGSIPHKPPKTSFLAAMGSSQVSSPSASGGFGGSDKSLLGHDGLK